MRTTAVIKTRAWLVLVQAAALAAGLTACIPATPRLDSELGSAVNTARLRQIANPDASRDATPVKGIDGQAGDAVFDNYRASFVDPRPALTGGVVNVGSGRTGTGGGGMGSR